MFCCLRLRCSGMPLYCASDVSMCSLYLYMTYSFYLTRPSSSSYCSCFVRYICVSSVFVVRFAVLGFVVLFVMPCVYFVAKFHCAVLFFSVCCVRVFCVTSVLNVTSRVLFQF